MNLIASNYGCFIHGTSFSDYSAITDGLNSAMAFQIYATTAMMGPYYSVSYIGVYPKWCSDGCAVLTFTYSATFGWVLK